MGKVIKLNERLTNLIAAGEVVTGPASVVKELVENAIDAGAGRITVSLADCGVKEIIVADDGSGMGPVDARLALEPHATSKIKEERDLFQIRTLGFRGEALPSIIAVSHFIMKTGCDGGKGMMFSLRGGALISEAVISFPRGTEISVKNLFYNMPARLQNLQSLSTELSYILDFVGKIALARPDIAFKVTNNDRLLIHTFGTGSLLEVIQSVYGNETAKSMAEIKCASGFYHIDGYIGGISVTKPTRNHINIIVNGRIIRNTKLISAVYEGYKGRLPKGQYPVCVIGINVDPSLIDVNIHPQKSEIKFSEEEALLCYVTESIDNILRGLDLIVETALPPKDIVIPHKTSYQTDYLAETEFSEDYNDGTYLDIFNESKPEVAAVVLAEEKVQQEYSFIEDQENLLLEEARLPKMYYIGQLFGTYILAQNEQNFYLIDQHAAYERVNYELYRQRLQKPDFKSYELLIPMKLDFAPAEAVRIREKITELAEIGIGIEDFGGGTFTIRSIPAWIPASREKEFAEEIIIKYLDRKQSEKHQFLDYLAMSLACKRSIKGNEPLTKEAAVYLLSKLNASLDPYTCPHGRPVIIKFGLREIEKWFKRTF